MKTIPQFEMQWDKPEGFALIQDAVPDYDKRRQEQAEKERQRKAFEAQQVDLFTP